jgi:hypothetical protein
MQTKRRMKPRIASATAGLVTGVLVLVGGATPARAATFDQVVTAATVAYEAYKKLSEGQLTLSQATTTIINAINAAKDEIVAHVDEMATIGIRACTMSAVIDYADIRSMSTDTLQAFARDTTNCAAQADDAIRSATSKPVIDEMGFALNTVGPIALLARARAFGTGSSAGLAEVVRGGNQSLLWRLAPSCYASPLWGDAEPGGPVEVVLRCTAFNGRVGTDFTFAYVRRGQPLPSFNYSRARARAMQGTSYQIAAAVLPVLNV